MNNTVNSTNDKTCKTFVLHGFFSTMYTFTTYLIKLSFSETAVFLMVLKLTMAEMELIFFFVQHSEKFEF